jgi:serine/threonine protein kinase
MHLARTILPIGTIIQNRYVVEALLGIGGYGAVYRVREQGGVKKLFALKEIIEPNKQSYDRFTFEYEMLQRLNHPGLPHIYQVFNDEEHARIYMLMSYVEGTNLGTLRRQQPDQRFSWSQTLELMTPILDAVAYLHRQSPPLLHRDIKPANILMPTAGNTPVLIDFGLAKEYDPDGTTTAARHCSPGFSAPEQYTRGTGPRSDIYGLGATLYTLITGCNPPDALERMMLQSEGGTDPLIPVKGIVPSVPTSVSEAIQRAMALNRNVRFASVEEFQQALHVEHDEEQAVVGLPEPTVVEQRVAARGPSLVRATKTRGSTPRSKKVGALSLAFLLLAVLVGIGFGKNLIIYAGGTQQPHSVLSPIASTTQRTQARSSVYATMPHSAHSATTPNPATPTPAPTTAPPAATFSSYPQVAGSFTGTIYDVPAQTTLPVNTISVQQDQGNISGSFVIESYFYVNGHFNGTINTARNVQFTVVDTSRGVVLYFHGSVQSNGTMQGNFCNLTAQGQCGTQYGNWSMTPA